MTGKEVIAVVTVLVQAPDTDVLQQLLGDLPTLTAAATQHGAAVVLIEDDRITQPSQEGR